MAGYDQRIKVNSRFASEAKMFFEFLNALGRKYARPIRFLYKYTGRGYFDVEVDGSTGGIDGLLQELLLNRALYYYCCAQKNKSQIIDNVILPIYRQLIDFRFENPQSRFLRKHLLGKHAQTDFIPSDIKNKFGYEFEMIFRRWDLGIVKDKDYIVEVDRLLHEFLLDALKHRPGERSDEFKKLLDRVKLPIEIHQDFKDAFLRFHTLRTTLLHRRQLPATTEDLQYPSLTIYNFFKLQDEYKESFAVRSVVIRGKNYKRIPYGKEVFDLDEEFDWDSFTLKNVCHDCFVRKGSLHLSGCDVEQCPKCHHQFISCDCKRTW